jgi:UrcA family protein
MSNSNFRHKARTAAVILAGAAGLALAAGRASAAAPEDAVPRIVVRYDSGMLATDEGVKQLYRRLNSAAEKVCIDESNNRFVSDAVIACRRQAVARAVHEIGNPHLAALQAARVKSG